MSEHPMLERVAKAIAEAFGDDLNHAFEGKSEWNAARGEKGGRYRDINEPMRGDYLAAARAALLALRDLSPEAVEVGMMALSNAGLGDVQESDARECLSAIIDHIVGEGE